LRHKDPATASKAKSLAENFAIQWLQLRRLEAQAPAMLRYARAAATELALPMKIVDAEPILGAERLTFYFTSEDRIDFRELVQKLAREYGARIEMRQVGARDEARITADYERCGQHCCCKQFLKVLKPVSMRSAKVQKATLDPLKPSPNISPLFDAILKEIPAPTVDLEASGISQRPAQELDAGAARDGRALHSVLAELPPDQRAVLELATGSGRLPQDRRAAVEAVLASWS
jgi:hypothetical protein